MKLNVNSTEREDLIWGINEAIKIVGTRIGLKSLLAKITPSVAPFYLIIETIEEKNDLEWLLYNGSKIYGTQHPGLVTLYDQYKIENTANIITINLVANSREEATELYKDNYALRTAKITWVGDLMAGNYGFLTEETLIAYTAKINYFRELCKIAPVSFANSLSDRCQAGCLYMSTNPTWTLSHTLDPSKINYSAKAAEACAKSCIERQHLGLTAVDIFIQDPGVSKIGHRINLMNPALVTIGIGHIPVKTSTIWPSTCLYTGTQKTLLKKAWAWPYAGYFPYQHPLDFWSFCSGGIPMAGAKVTINGQAVSIKETLGDTIVFKCAYPFSGPSVHDIEITGPINTQYTVQRFNPFEAV